MKLMSGNIINYIERVDAVCVTTNGIVKSNGELVMGMGCAKAFKDLYPTLPKVLGEKVKEKGNVPIVAGKAGKTYIISFPTKNHYKDNSDIDLIKNSATKLVEICDYLNIKSIIIPSPGTGLGNLDKNNVYPMLSEILDDRFSIIEFRNNNFK